MLSGQLPVTEELSSANLNEQQTLTARRFLVNANVMNIFNMVFLHLPLLSNPQSPPQTKCIPNKRITKLNFINPPS
jgi:hypothetical protein